MDLLRRIARTSTTLLPPAVTIHGSEDASAALSLGRRLVFASAPGAGCYGGARWWRLVVDGAAAAHPGLVAADILDCGADAARAVEALREGCRMVVLDPASRAWDDVAERAATVGAELLRAPPPALDLAVRGASRRLEPWLDGAAPPV